MDLEAMAYEAVLEDLVASRPDRGVCVSPVYFTSPDSAVGGSVIDYLTGQGYGVLPPLVWPDTASVLVAFEEMTVDPPEVRTGATLVQAFDFGRGGGVDLEFTSHSYTLECGDSCRIIDRRLYSTGHGRTSRDDVSSCPKPGTGSEPSGPPTPSSPGRTR